MMKAVQWFAPPEKEEGRPRPLSLNGRVIYIPARHVVQPSRGIAYNQPAGWFAQTWMGNIPVASGDWIVTYPSGNVYVVKDVDMTKDVKRRKLWDRLFK